MSTENNNTKYTYTGFAPQPMEVYIKGLSGLRFLGIFGVILYHMYPYHIKGGFLGVTLLFILSGYLLAVKSEESRRLHNFNTLDFYKKRIKRLYPQLIIVLLVTAAVLKFTAPSALIGIRQEAASIIFGYNNIWQIFQNASYFDRIANSSPFTHMWSLANEVQFFVIWPLIFAIFIYATKHWGIKWAINIIGILAVITAIIMTIVYFTNPDGDVTRIYYGTDTRIFSFFTGAYIGFRRVEYRKNVRIKNPGFFINLFMFLTGIVLLCYVFVRGEAGYTYMGGMLLVNIIMAIMLYLVVEGRLPIGELLEKRVFKFFGQISYEMYLWMYPVIYVFYRMKLNKYMLAPLLILLTIIILSYWLNRFAVILVNKRFDMSGSWIYRLAKLGFVLISICFILGVGFGSYSMAIAPKDNSEEIAIMQREMERNIRKIKMENEEYSTNVAASSVNIVDTSNENAEEPKDTIPNIITAVGDSVMLGASPSIMNLTPACIIDATESRQAANTLEAIKALDAEGKLGRTVIIGVGTNGPFSESVGQEIIDYLGKNRNIYWVNVYAESIQWVSQSNSVINRLVEKNKNVTLIDWYSLGESHPEWFYNDGVHLREDSKGQGQSGYAKFIVDSIAASNMEAKETQGKQ